MIEQALNCKNTSDFHLRRRALHHLLLTALILVTAGHAAHAVPHETSQQIAARLTERGMKMMDRGDYKGARAPLLEALQYEPKNPRIYWGLARSSYNTMDRYSQGLDEAEKYLKKAISIDPAYSNSYIQMTEIKNIQGKYDEAITWADKGIACQPPQMECYPHKAVALSNLHRHDQALACIDKYLSYKGKDVSFDALEIRASVLENAGRYSAAIAAYETCYQLKKQDTYLLRQVTCYDLLNKPLEAVKVLDKLIATNPSDDTALVKRAKFYIKAGKLELALADYNKAIKEMSGATYYRERAALHKKMGHMDLYAKDMKAAEND